MPFPEYEVGDLLSADELNDRVPILTYKTAQESRANTTALVADSELQVQVKANRVYLVQAAINYSSPGTNSPDLGLGWSGPSGAGMWWGMNGLDVGQTTPYGPMVTHFSTVPNPTNRAVGSVGSATGPSVGASYPLQVLMQGILTTAATAGTFAFLWAQFNTSATAVIVREASYIMLTPMRRS